ncbi:hypothetical protein RF11_12675 [Thelohanellus kitauei]|uniref:Uncharacterized protein n=1 Tax=Thelohanellus kitauei TaxID=669202 RepID=A0A0C2N5E6_THEKT|nr:hypothetical protein RF11_12675 [Thelohanellus kitauei]
MGDLRSGEKIMMSPKPSPAENAVFGISQSSLGIWPHADFYSNAEKSTHLVDLTCPPYLVEGSYGVGQRHLTAGNILKISWSHLFLCGKVTAALQGLELGLIIPRLASL